MIGMGFEGTTIEEEQADLWNLNKKVAAECARSPVTDNVSD